MAKMVISHLFMDILAAILKGALYLESLEFFFFKFPTLGMLLLNH